MSGGPPRLTVRAVPEVKDDPGGISASIILDVANGWVNALCVRIVRVRLLAKELGNKTSLPRSEP